ncbi:MAG: hypothetical protein ABIK44_06475 [candidate division WOR-3 bacterium]
MQEKPTQNPLEIPGEPEDDGSVLEGLLKEYFDPAVERMRQEAVESEAESESEIEPEVEAEAETEKEPKAEEPEPEKKPEKKYRYQGKEYTLAELEAAGLLDKVLVSAEQMPHFQRLYEEKMKELAELSARLPKEEPTAQPIGPTPQMIEATYRPVVSKAVEDGWIESDLAEAFPRFVSAALYHLQRLDETRQWLNYLLVKEAEREKVVSRERVVEKLDALCDSISAKGDVYAALSDKEIRRGFYDYLAELDAPVSNLSEEFIKRQWIAYNHDALVEAAIQKAAAKTRVEEMSRKRAAGDGVSAPGHAKQTPKSIDEQLLESFLEGHF